MVDDDFDLYVNGMLVRSDWNGEASYFVDDISTLVQTGFNVIAIKVSDTFGGCQHLGFDVIIEKSTLIEVPIDIKSGIEPNNLYCQWGELVRRGIFDVAILTTDSFDATTVDHTTVTFEGAKEIHFDWRTRELRRHEIDVDRDGDIDLLFHFRLGDTDLKCNSTEGTLIGETFDGVAIQGTDSVRMVNYNPPRPSPPPYYAALPHPPNSTQATLTFGLLTFGFLFGAGLVIGLPSRLKNRK
jgi:hypothetical protein